MLMFTGYYRKIMDTIQSCLRMYANALVQTKPRYWSLSITHKYSSMDLVS